MKAERTIKSPLQLVDLPLPDKWEPRISIGILEWGDTTKDGAQRLSGNRVDGQERGSE